MTDTFSKTVAIKAVDEDERTATGAVLVPNEVDKQRDFLRPEGVEAMFAEDPKDGVLHAAFPDDAAELTRNEIVEEPIELNGERYPAGTWVATRQYDDDDLWKLVEDGILSGFSIGGEVSEVREFEAADVPDDVTFPDPVTPGPATEIVDGQVEEVSDVDIPAVPRATFREVGKLGKSITDRVENESEFVEVMETRGHDAEDARELWTYLQTHKLGNERAESRADDTNNDAMSDSDTETDESDAEKADPTAESIGDVDDATLGQRIKAAFGFGDGSGSDDATEAEAQTQGNAEKAGRTLSQRNRRAVMASVDAQLDILDDAGVDHGMTRFTDRADFAFDIEQYGKGSYDDKPDKDETDKDAPAGETADTDMSNDESTDDAEKSEEPPAWADSLTEKVEQIEKRVDEMDDDAEKGLDDAPEWAQSLAEKVDDLDERVDTVSKATADTQQTGGAEQTGETGDELSKTEKQKRAVFLPNGGR